MAGRRQGASNYLKVSIEDELLSRFERLCTTNFRHLPEYGIRSRVVSELLEFYLGIVEGTLPHDPTELLRRGATPSYRAAARLYRLAAGIEHPHVPQRFNDGGPPQAHSNLSSPASDEHRPSQGEDHRSESQGQVPASEPR